MTAATASETAAWNVASSNKRAGFLLVDWLRFFGGMVFLQGKEYKAMRDDG